MPYQCVRVVKVTMCAWLSCRKGLSIWRQPEGYLHWVVSWIEG